MIRLNIKRYFNKIFTFDDHVPRDVEKTNEVMEHAQLKVYLG